MANWYCSREQVKRAGNIDGTSFNTRIDRIIESVSRQRDNETRRFFIPRTETRLHRWPPEQSSRSYILWLDQDLISVTTLQTQAQDASPTTISSSDFFLEPNNTGPPYDRIEIDLSSTASLESGDTPQRSISVAGSWGFSADTKSSGTVSSGLDSDATATTFVCSDSSLIDVGNTLLIESEQVFVSDRAFANLGSILIDGALTQNNAEVSVTVDGSHGLSAGEVIMVDSEKMFIESINSNTLTVVRAYDDSRIAAHNDNTAVQVARTLTIERGVNGTTAATHADATAISKYEPPFDIQNLCIAESLAMFAQEGGHWGRVVGTGEGQREFNGRNLSEYRKMVKKQYQRLRMAVV